MASIAAGENWDTIVLGAGVSGLVAASVLSERLSGNAPAAPSILMLDDYPELGGNHTSVDIGPYSFDIGSFIFSDASRFLAHFPRMIPLLANQERGTFSSARITPALRLARYPFDIEEDFLRSGPLASVRTLASVLHGRLFRDQDRNAEDFCRYWVGDRFYRQSGLRDYMERLYGEDPARIESAFAHKRLGWVKRNARVKTIIRPLASRVRPRAKAGTERLLVRPQDGFQAMYRVAEEDLKARGVDFRLGAGLARIEGAADRGFVIQLADGTRLGSRQLISTIPLTHSLPLFGLDAPRGLRTANLLSLFVSFAGKRGFDANALYNFSREGRWKRLTMHSDFYGPRNGREYFSVEITQRWAEAEPAAALAEFRSLTERTGIFEGDLQLEGFRLTQHAYPVYLQGATAAAEAATGQLRDIGVLSFGRQGGFDYQPTAAVSADVAMRQLAGRS